MIVLLGIALGAVVFLWTLSGSAGALRSLRWSYATEPNIAAHVELVTTDFGVTCFLFTSVYLLWRACRRWTVFNAAGAAALGVLAMLSKFSGLAILPIFAALATIAVARGRMRWPNAVFLLLGVVVFAFAGAWSVYGFRYDPSRTPDWRFTLHAQSAAQAAVPARRPRSRHGSIRIDCFPTR